MRQTLFGAVNFSTRFPSSADWCRKNSFVSMAAGARSWAATGYTGCRRGRGCVPTLERGHDQNPGAHGAPYPRSCVNGYLYVGCAVRTICLQDIGHHGATHPARASWAPGAAKAPTRALISLFYRGHGPLLPPRPCSSVGAGRARDGRRETVAAATGYAGRRSVRGCVPALKHGNSQMLLPQDFPSRGGRPAPPGGRFGAGRVSGEANSSLALSRSAGCGTGKKGQTV